MVEERVPSLGHPLKAARNISGVRQSGSRYFGPRHSPLRAGMGAREKTSCCAASNWGGHPRVWPYDCCGYQ